MKIYTLKIRIKQICNQCNKITLFKMNKLMINDKNKILIIIKTQSLKMDSQVF